MSALIMDGSRGLFTDSSCAMVGSAVCGRKLAIERIDRAPQLVVAEQCPIGRADADAVAKDHAVGNRQEHWPEIHAGLEQQEALATRIDADAFKNAPVPRFLIALSDHDLRVAGVEY